MKCILNLVLLPIALALLAGCTAAPPRPVDKGIAFGLMGDTPYSAAEAVRLDALIDELNREELAFVVHVGDITSGRGPCTDEWFEARKAQLQRIRHPVVIIPGDNDWADCRRGGMQPMERLAKFRELFHAGGESLGARRIPVERPTGEYAEFREHMRWEAGGVQFVTLSVQGGNNNLGGRRAVTDEYRQRMAAVNDWLAQAEQRVAERRLAGLVILIHANPDFEESWLKMKRPGAYDGFADFRASLRALVKRLGRPVLLVHGDSHRFQLDQPLRDAATGATLAGFTRVEVWGSPWVRWVRGRLHPGAAVPFSITPSGAPDAPAAH
ncbi:MAG: hypothetical protein FJY55_02290 [Betaproteobacteria bacterium]|nr:hypothetical protein [Betaproteobacteria bacterium]